MFRIVVQRNNNWKLIFCGDRVGFRIVIRENSFFTSITYKKKKKKTSAYDFIANRVVRVASRSGAKKKEPIIRGRKEHCDWFILPLIVAARQTGFQTLDRKRQSHKRSRKKMETFWFLRFRFRRAYGTTYNIYKNWFWFSLGHRRSYYSAYESNSEFVASAENQPWWPNVYYRRVIRLRRTNRLDINSVFRRILASNSSRILPFLHESSADEFGAKIRLNTEFISRQFIHLRRIIRLRGIIHL